MASTIETICGAGHVESWIQGPHANIWLDRSICRRITDGRQCHAVIIAIFVFPPEPAEEWVGEDEDMANAASLELDEDEVIQSRTRRGA